MNSNDKTYEMTLRARDRVWKFQKDHPDVRIKFEIVKYDIVTGETFFEVVFKRRDLIYKRTFAINALYICHDWITIFDYKLQQMYTTILKEEFPVKKEE